MAGQRESLSRTLAGGSDIVFDFTCQPCSGDNKTLEAVGFCVDCSEFLCDECFKYHLKPPLTRNHKLLDIEEAKKDKDIARYQDVCTEKCSQHSGEIIKYFCSDHNNLGCVACMTVDHRNCPRVKFIPDIAEDIANSDTYSGLIHTIDTVLLKTKSLISKSTENQAKSQAQCSQVLKDMEQVKKDVMEALERLETAMQAEAEKIKLKDAEKMDANIAVFDNIQHEAETLALNLKTMKDNGQYCKLFVAMKKEKCDIMSLESKLDEAAKDKSVTDYFFRHSTQLEELIKYKNSLGKLSQQAGVQRKTTKLGEISMRTGNDSKTCIIMGLANLPDGRLVATDYTNQKVKLIDVTQSKVISELKLQGRPQDITITDETNEIAVALGQPKILLLKVSRDTMLKHREIPTSKDCFGVASVNANLVVSLPSPERLEIIDKKGNVLHKIVHDQNGRQLFSNVHSVTVSLDGDTIYVPDWSKSTVTCLSVLGNVKAVYKDNDLQKARYVAVDGRGNLYVGGQNSQNVHQITPDCRKISIRLSKKDGIDKLGSLCYSTEKDRLYVGQESDTLLIFQLS